MIILRAFRIGGAAAGLLWAAAAERLRPGAGPGFPVRLRRTLERLGPTFVKLGQALSQRRDLLPDRWTSELSRLQADARPFAAETAAAAVQAALGAPAHDLFESFDPSPLAAASVAQVHRALLHDGREVVVKILRPGVRTQIDRDMRILLGVAAFAGATIPALRRRRTTALVRELWRNLRRETDLREEARNIRRFARAFEGSPTVFIPDVVEALSAEGVLVQVMSHGHDISDPSLAAQAGVLSRAWPAASPPSGPGRSASCAAACPRSKTLRTRGRTHPSSSCRTPRRSSPRSGPRPGWALPCAAWWSTATAGPRSGAARSRP